MLFVIVVVLVVLVVVWLLVTGVEKSTNKALPLTSLTSLCFAFGLGLVWLGVAWPASG